MIYTHEVTISGYSYPDKSQLRLSYWQSLIDKLILLVHCLSTHSLVNRPKY